MIAGDAPTKLLESPDVVASYAAAMVEGCRAGWEHRSSSMAAM